MPSVINEITAPGTGYPIVHVSRVAGAHQTVADLAARDAILSSSRLAGMSCYVIDQKTTYRLVGGTTNAHWVEEPTGGGNALLHPQPNYRSWGRTGICTLMPNDSFGGPAVWDPVAGLYRSYWHKLSGTNEIVMYTSHDGVAWSGRQVVLTPSQGTGKWWDLALGVPFVVRTDHPSRPWVMFARGRNTPDPNYYMGVWTSADGVTWQDKAQDGTDLTGPAIGPNQTAASIDEGNVFHAEGYWWMYWNHLGNRRQWLSRSKDLKTWEHLVNTGAWATGTIATPLNIFEGRQNASGQWDYDDDSHNSHSANLVYGYFCGWFGFWPRPDGTPEYVAILPTYTVNDAGTNRHGALSVWTSRSPIFTKANRQFRGFITRSDTPAMNLWGRPVSPSGFDVPRIFCLDWRQNPSSTAQRHLWYSFSVDAGEWRNELLIRPAGLPVAIMDDDYSGAVLQNVDGLLPLDSHCLQLAPVDANALVTYCPGVHRAGLVDMSGNGLHAYGYGQEVEFNANGVRFGRTLGGFAVHDPGSTPTPFTQAISALTVEAWAEKSAVLGAGVQARIISIGGSTRQLGLRLDGSSGDTACTLYFWITDSGGTQRAIASDPFSWTTGRKHIAVTWDGTNARFYLDGSLQSTKGLSHTGGHYTDTEWTLWLGGREGFQHWWPGHLDDIRISKIVRYTSSFTPAALPIPRTTEGFVFSGVHDFGQSVRPMIEMDAGVLPNTTLEVRYRAAGSATDRASTWSAFTNAMPAGRYQQFALRLAGNGTSTPIIRRVRLRGVTTN